VKLADLENICHVGVVGDLEAVLASRYQFSLRDGAAPIVKCLPMQRIYLKHLQGKIRCMTIVGNFEQLMSNFPSLFLNKNCSSYNWHCPSLFKWN